MQELTQINPNQVPISTPLAVPAFQVAGTLLTSTSIINYEGDGTYIGTSNPSGGQVEISLLETGITFATPGVIYTAPGLVELGGTATFTLATQSANTIFAGPSSGLAATPTFRSLVSLDIPNNGANTTGNAATVTGLSVASGKTLAVSNSLTLAGTDSTTMTFPSSSDTVVTLAASQTLSNKTFTAPVLGTPTSGTLTNCTFPTLNQNTTGTAGGLSGTPSITVNALSATGNGTFGLSSYTAAVTSSPSLIFAGSYESASTPAYAEDSWNISNVIGSGLEGTSTLTFAHLGTTGAASLSVGGSISSLGSQTLTGALGVAGVVYTNVSTGHSAVISNSNVYATTAAGYYRVSAMVWPTTNSSSAWDVYVLATMTPNGGTAAMQFTVSPVVNIDGAAVAAWGQNSMVYLASSATIGISIASTSGSNTSGVYSYSVTIERLG